MQTDESFTMTTGTHGTRDPEASAARFAADMERVAEQHDKLRAECDPLGYHAKSAERLRAMARAARDPSTPLGKWARNPRVTR